ncbi:MAG TPA: cyclic pyranopterin monophosphate synthase MoaC [Actinomycetota bacterium]|nr:cyclic pyranopterin monophosphate synthase MoaC [Actinomycetota bacterium]
MVDVTEKPVTDREAEASGVVRMRATTRELVVARSLDKGDALEVARIAGIMGAKKTSELIPLCHPIQIGSVDVVLAEVEDGIEIRATVRTAERTGVEMEALCAVSVAALTIYDMIKSTDRSASVTDVRLLRKSGGRSGDWAAPSLPAG